MNDWHLLCITNRGKVSILKNLDLQTARQAYQKLKPNTRPVKFINQEYAAEECIMIEYDDCDPNFGQSSESIEKVEALGPEGQELDPWFGVEPIVIDYKKTPYA